MNPEKKAEKQIRAIIKNAKKAFVPLMANLESITINGKEFKLDELKAIITDFNKKHKNINEEDLKELFENFIKDKDKKDGMVKREKVERKFNNNDSDEILDYYLTKTQTPVMIHSPFAFNLGNKLRKYDENPISIRLGEPGHETKLEDILGVTVFDKKGTKYEAPKWYTLLLDKWLKAPNKKHLLCIYGITKVDPSIQLYFQDIILNRSVNSDPANKLPENCSVIFVDDIDEEYYYPLWDVLNSKFEHIYYDHEKSDIIQYWNQDETEK